MKKSKGLSKSLPTKPTKNFAVMVKKTAINKIRYITKALLTAPDHYKLILKGRLEHWEGIKNK